MSNNTILNTPPHLEVTDNRKEMEKIGREIFNLNPQIYTDRLTEVISRNVDKYLPNATSEEKESAIYRSIYDYWVYGNTVAEEFFFDFPNKTHKEKSEYIVMRKRVNYLNRLNDKKIATELLDNKYNTYKFLGEYFKRDIVKISGEEDYENFCEFISKHTDFFVKPVNFSCGLNIQKDSIANYSNARELFDKLLLRRKTLSADTTRDFNLQVTGDVDIILEEPIKQHPEMAKFHPNSINGVRVTAVKINGDIKIFYPFLKIGQHGNFVDNGGSGGLLIGINSVTGCTETEAFDEIEHATTPIEYHPDTNIKLRNLQIPRWDEAISLAKELTGKFDKINYIGWDFALTPDGWCVIEGNRYGDMGAMQTVHQKGLRKEFEKLIGWKLDKNFWWE